MPARGPLPFDPIAEAERHWRDHGWAPAAPGMAVVTSVMRVQQVFLARVDSALRPMDLTFARYEVLMLLMFSRRGELPLGKIGERLQVHPASVTSVIDRLEQHRLVRRVPHPTDGRATLAALTAEGRHRAAEATELLNDSVFVATGLDDDELRTLEALLRSVRVAAGDFSA